MRHLRTRGAAALTGAAVLVATVVAVLPAGAEAASAASSSTAITLYNGQHEQTTDQLVSAFERQTGIHVNVRSDDEDVLANQIVQEGSNTPADAFYTENSAPLELLQEKGLLAPLARSTLAAVPTQYSSPKGDWVGVSARVSVLIYNTGLLSPSQLPTLGDGPGVTQVERQARHRPGRDRLPAHRDVDRTGPRHRGRAPVVAGGQVQRRRPHLPRQRDAHLDGQPGSDRPRDHQPLLLVPDGRRAREARRPLR